MSQADILLYKNFFISSSTVSNNFLYDCLHSRFDISSVRSMASDQDSCLLIVDDQRAFLHPSYWGPARSNPGYESNLARLLAASRDAGLFIIHVKHLSTTPGSALHPSAPAPSNHPLGGLGVDFNKESTPIDGEPIVEKNVNSAFIGTNLENMLRERRIRTLYITGITTDHCVSTTTRMAANLHVCDVTEDGNVTPGKVVLVEDATACFQKPDGKWDAETVHAVNVESLQEFAEIESTDTVVSRLTRKSGGV